MRGRARIRGKALAVGEIQRRLAPMNKNSAWGATYQLYREGALIRTRAGCPWRRASDDNACFEEIEMTMFEDALGAAAPPRVRLTHAIDPLEEIAEAGGVRDEVVPSILCPDFDRALAISCSIAENT